MQLNVTVGDMISWMFILNIASQGHQRRRKVVERRTNGSSACLFWIWLGLGFRLDRAYESSQHILVVIHKKIGAVIGYILLCSVALRCLLAFELPLLTSFVLLSSCIYLFPSLFFSFLFFSFFAKLPYSVCNYPVCFCAGHIS